MSIVHCYHEGEQNIYRHTLSKYVPFSKSMHILKL
jgi:hypothetical protein